jgi:hypothetical protein
VDGVVDGVEWTRGVDFLICLIFQLNDVLKTLVEARFFNTLVEMSLIKIKYVLN